MKEFVDQGMRREAEDRKRSLKALRELLAYELRTTRKQVAAEPAEAN